MDPFYTSPELAALLANAARVRRPERVADFAMGDGALLRAARLRWPDAVLFGSDIRSEAIKSVFGLDDTVETTVCDFLDDVKCSEALEGLKGGFDVILLNPPFTCRGNQRHTAMVGEITHRASRALAFVARSMSYLTPGGEALVILPSSCLTSERDSGLLQDLKARFRFEQIGTFDRNAFPGCSVSVRVLRLQNRQPKKTPAKALPPPRAIKPYTAEIMRGCISVHGTVRERYGTPVVHTFDLKQGRDYKASLWSSRASRIVSGWAVLIPRVGRADRSKMVHLRLEDTALSDCVIAIRAEPVAYQAEMFRLLQANWQSLQERYGGSCAPYLTMGQVQAWLGELGVGARIVTCMRKPATCEMWRKEETLRLVSC